MTQPVKGDRVCLPGGYRVYVSAPQSGRLHQTPADAREEAFLAAGQAEDGIAEVRGPDGYRERIDSAAVCASHGEQHRVALSRTRRDALRLAVEVLEEHAGASENPGAMTAAAAELDALIAACAGAGPSHNAGVAVWAAAIGATVMFLHGKHAVGCPAS
ncbi:MAG: hypothetical protein ACRDK7_08280 [Solirubrobacteraceae bacterium]